MGPSLKHVQELAHALAPEDRAKLAQSLLESLQEPTLAEVREAWDLEIESRLAAFDRGEIPTYTAEDVFSKLRGCSR
ncbi:MAG: addiction module protein [Gammaproteobacteria bacterium]|nr:addiction module protein [Gammaproteobacteria bacterium]